MQLHTQAENEGETIIDLEEHFKQHGMSTAGYKKIQKDIENGDMTVNILTQFNESELIKMSTDDYNMTTLQRKAFIEAIKLLPNSKASAINFAVDNDEKKQNENDVDQHVKEFVYVEPQEQGILNQITQLKKRLDIHLKQCLNVKIENKNKIVAAIDKLKIAREKIKQSVDDAINILVAKVL